MLLIDAEAELLAEEEVRAAAGSERLLVVCRRWGQVCFTACCAKLCSTVCWLQHDVMSRRELLALLPALLLDSALTGVGNAPHASQPLSRSPGEMRLPAHVNSLQQGPRWCSVLREGNTEVWGAEQLLAALECCGVDNARIEVEGGRGKLQQHGTAESLHRMAGMAAGTCCCICRGQALTSDIVQRPSTQSLLAGARFHSCLQRCPSLMALHWAGQWRRCVLAYMQHPPLQAQTWQWRRGKRNPHVRCANCIWGGCLNVCTHWCSGSM